MIERPLTPESQVCFYCQHPVRTAPYRQQAHVVARLQRVEARPVGEQPSAYETVRVFHAKCFPRFTAHHGRPWVPGEMYVVTQERWVPQASGNVFNCH